MLKKARAMISNFFNPDYSIKPSSINYDPDQGWESVRSLIKSAFHLLPETPIDDYPDDDFNGSNKEEYNIGES